MNVCEETIFKCGKCRKTHYTRSSAEQCCVDKKCADCGREIDQPHRDICRSCMYKRWDVEAREKWEKAEKVNASEYDGWVVYKGDNYFGSVDEFLESEFCYEEVPSWGLRTTEKRYITLDPQRIVEDLEESDMAYEDYEVTGFAKKAIEDFCSAWNTNHAEYAFWGTNIGIVLDEEYLRKVGDEHGTDNQL